MAVGTRGRGKKAAGGDADTPAFGGIAERYRRAGDLDKAIALCREGLKKFPDQISGRVTLGWALLDQGKYDEAQVELEYALKRAPDNLAAIRGLAELHDRAENTMMLPMDGPGQWPPDSAMIEEAVEAVEAVQAVAEEPEPVAGPPPPEPEPPAATDTHTNGYDTPANGFDAKANGYETKANGYDTTPAVYTRASDASPTPARKKKPATMDIDPPMSDAELSALTALLQQEEAQAAAEAQLPAADVVAETETETAPEPVAEELPLPTPVSVSGADLALELLAASASPVEIAPELSLGTVEPDELIAALEAHAEPAKAEVADVGAVSKTYEVPGTLEVAIGEVQETYEVPGTLEVAVGEVQETYEVPGTLEVGEAAEAPQTFEAPETFEILEPPEVPDVVETPVAVEAQPVMEIPEPAEIPAIAEMPPMVEMPQAIEAEPSAEMPERVEAPEPFDVRDLEMPAAMTDGVASQEFSERWTAEAAPAPAREPETPDLGIAAFQDHFEAAEHGAHTPEVAAFPARHEDPPARSDEAADRFDDLIHAPAAADASAFAARELPTPVDHHDELELPDVDFAAAASAAPEDFAARVAESAMHARAAASGHDSTDFRGPADMRADEPSELQGWAVELTPSALIAPEPPDLRSAEEEEEDEIPLRHGYGGQDHLHQAFGGPREHLRMEVVAAPAAAAVAVADRPPFAKAPDDKSPASRLHKMLRRIEMRRLETARESVA